MVEWWSGGLGGWIIDNEKTSSRGVTHSGLGKASAVQIQQLSICDNLFGLQRSANSSSYNKQAVRQSSTAKEEESEDVVEELSTVLLDYPNSVFHHAIND